MTHIIVSNDLMLLQNLYGSIVFGLLSTILLDTPKRPDLLYYSIYTMFCLCEMERAGLLY